MRLVSDRGRELSQDVVDVQSIDAMMTGALASAGLRVTVTHPALPHIRPTFATAWIAVAKFIWKMATNGVEIPIPATRSIDNHHLGATQARSPLPSTPILQHKEEWKVSRVRSGQSPRGVASYVSDLRQFAEDNPTLTLETINKRNVREWVAKLHSDKVSVVTIRRKLSALRAYWQYLQTQEFVAEGNNPYTGLVLPKINAVEAAENARKRFAPAAVVDLWRRAEISGKQDLSDVIKLAAYTGARLASIVALTSTSVRTEEESRIRVVHFKDKTAAGVRDVPIHSAISSLIDRLIKDAGDGFLFPRGGVNKYDRRSNVHSMAFSRLKTDAGFDKQYCFHSIRHTFAMLIRVEGREESFTAELLGHRHPGISHGRYGRNTPLAVLADVMEKGLIYPD